MTLERKCKWSRVVGFTSKSCSGRPKNVLKKRDARTELLF